MSFVSDPSGGAAADGVPALPAYLKISSGFLLREIAGENLIVPVGKAAARFNGLASVNGAGLTIWKLLQDGSDLEGLVQDICAAYEVCEETARADILEFLRKLQANHILEGS